jgi:hypothetical protein
MVYIAHVKFRMASRAQVALAPQDAPARERIHGAAHWVFGAASV